MEKTILDFKDHIHTTRIFKDEEGNEIREDRFGKKDTYVYSITFLNHSRGCAITGDYGAWSVGRNLIPREGEELYVGYFAEKIRNANYSQKTSDFDSDEADREIQEIIDGLDEDDLGDDFEKVKEWWEELMRETENEHTFIEKAHYDYYRPDCIDSEEIPQGKVGNVQVQIICEAFNEMCKRLKTNKKD